MDVRLFSNDGFYGESKGLADAECSVFFFFTYMYIGAWGSVVVKALRYKSEGPGIETRRRRGFFRGIWQFHVP
jgi:hypothetical protein